MNEWMIGMCLWTPSRWQIQPKHCQKINDFKVQWAFGIMAHPPTPKFSILDRFCPKVQLWRRLYRRGYHPKVSMNPSFWLYFWYILTTYWLQFGYILPTCWLHSVTCWLHFGHILDTFCLHFGNILATFWLHSGYILATFWLHSYYILATF